MLSQKSCCFSLFSIVQCRQDVLYIVMLGRQTKVAKPTDIRAILVLAAWVSCRSPGTVCANAAENALDPEAAAILAEIKSSDRPQDACARLYRLMFEEHALNRHDPDEVMPIATVMLRWALDRGSIPGCRSKRPIPPKQIATYKHRTILMWFDGKSGKPEGWKVARCYDVSRDVFRGPTTQETRMVQERDWPAMTKRGYSPAFVEHRARGSLAFVLLHLDILLDLRMVFEKTAQGWQFVHPYTVYWGLKTR